MRDWSIDLANRFRGEGGFDPSTEADIVRELAQHFEQRHAELRGFGLSDADADAELETELLQLDVAALVAARHQTRSSVAPIGVDATPTVRGWLESIWRDVVIGWRSLRRSPGLSAVIIVSLAIVLGANTALVALTDAIYLRRLPVPAPEQLVRLDLRLKGRRFSLPYARFQTLANALPDASLAAFRFEGVEAIAESGDEQRLWLELVTGSYFGLVGVKPSIGRAIDASDESSASHVAVVSDEFWRQHLGARTDVLGQTLRLNGQPFTIVGVMPAHFGGIHFAHHFQIAAPFTVSPTGFHDSRVLSTTIIARLDGRRDPRAQRAALDAAIQSCCSDDAQAGARDAVPATGLHIVPVDDPPIAEGAPPRDVPKGITIRLEDASRGLTWGRDLRARYGAAVVVVNCAVALLLLIAGSNAAILLLVRGEARIREFAIRQSLGASAGRIRRQLLIEVLELCLLGGVLGLPVAWLAITILAGALPASARPLGDVIAWHASPRVIAMTFAASVGCAIVASVLPLFRIGRGELAAALAGHRARGTGGAGVQRLLAITQVTLATVLITAAWLLVATIRNLTRSADVFASRNSLLVQVDARSIPDSGGARSAAIDALIADVRRTPGVSSVAYSYNAPLIQDGMMLTRFSLNGVALTTRLNLVSPNFFAALGGALTRGRDFNLADDPSSDRVAIVSEAFERRYFGARSAIGALLSTTAAGGSSQTTRIIGVARDLRYDRMASVSADLRNPEMEMVYVPIAQLRRQPPVVTVIVHSDAAPVSMIEPVRRTAARRTEVRVDRITSIGQWLDDATSRERFSASLVSGFGAVAAMLSAIGLLGVLSFQIARRTKEIGVRMALGAQRSDAVRLVARETSRIVVAALAIGVPCAIGAAVLLRAQLYAVAPWDPRAVFAAAFGLATVSILASVLPSYRAASVDPLVALREE